MNGLSTSHQYGSDNLVNPDITGDDGVPVWSDPAVKRVTCQLFKHETPAGYKSKWRWFVKSRISHYWGNLSGNRTFLMFLLKPTRLRDNNQQLQGDDVVKVWNKQ